MSEKLSDIGLIGLAVMGQNLALNIADHGFLISVYNRTQSKMDDFIEKNSYLKDNLIGKADLKSFVLSLKKPRKIIILVQAGPSTDAVINSLVPFLEAEDIIIDGGNAHWLDTIRREKMLAEKDLQFVGCGVSGGEEGARFGPSLMPGGALKAWQQLEPILSAVAAKVDNKTGKPILGASAGHPTLTGESCAAYIGPNGAGHYLKMVHNGIEYADMQLICEAYDLMRQLLQLSPQEMSDIFKEWNSGPLDSFLIEITSNVLKQLDPETQKPLVDVILDTAGQKGTGKWTSMHALELGVTAPSIAESVFARNMSSLKEERVNAAKDFASPLREYKGDKNKLIQAIHDALYCSKICAYAQGFQLLQAAQKEYDWTLDFASIAKIWRAGCIIRAAFLQKITEAYATNPGLKNLVLDPYFKNAIQNSHENWRKVVALGAENGIAVPNFSSALCYFDSYRNASLPHNLLQGMRDYFGSHTYERVDKPRGQFYHLEWSSSSRSQMAVQK